MSDKEKRSAALIRAYALERHPEGGWFSEVFTAAEGGERKLAGSIYFLLDRDDISHFHQIDCEELWYFHEGCGLNIYIREADGSCRTERLGNDFDAGEKPMVSVGKGAIFAAENLDPTAYTFISCATAPKFSYEGFRLVPRCELSDAAFPERLFSDTAGR